MVGLTHLHPDHTSDFAALLWGSNRARDAALPVVGPSGNGAAPDVKTFLSRMFDATLGGYQVLGSVLGAEQPGAERPRLDIRVVDATSDESTKVYDRDGITVTALLLMHMAIAAKSPPNPGHAAPATVGRLAQEAGVKRLVVSHIGQYNLDDAVAELRASYGGPLTVGSDLQCTQAK